MKEVILLRPGGTTGVRSLRWVTRGAVLLSMTVLGPACAMRYPYTEIDSNWYDGKVKHGGFLPPIELSLMTNDIAVGPSAFVFSLEFSSQDLDPSVLPPMKDWQSVSIQSTMLGARLYPFNRGPILPYGGGGFGRTTLSANWIEYTGGGFDPLFECIAFCDDTEDKRGSLLTAYHPYLAAGLELRPGFMRPSILLEYRRDLNRGDDFYELSGQSVSIGARWRMRR